MNREEDCELVSIDNKKEWNNTIKMFGECDTYHSAEFHQLAQQQGEGQPWLFKYFLGNYHAALPFLIRPLSGVDGLQGFKQFDATSVYGYPGILSSISPEDPGANEFKNRFQGALEKILRKLSVIALFTRQNPMIDSSWLLKGYADVVTLGPTVSINLRIQEIAQNKEMTKGHRYDIRRARNNGVTAREVEYFEFIDTFISIYNETMERTRAGGSYFFSKQYYLKLKESLGDAVKLYIAEIKDETIAAAIFLLSNKIIQYHLSGARTALLSLSGTKLIIDEVRRWATDKGFYWFHLGGGVGSKEDSLFRFKAGFSKCRFHFEIIKWIIDPIVYNEAVNRIKPLDSCFFPAYRTPLNKKIHEKMN